MVTGPSGFAGLPRSFKFQWPAGIITPGGAGEFTDLTEYLHSKHANRDNTPGTPERHAGSCVRRLFFRSQRPSLWPLLWPQALHGSGAKLPALRCYSVSESSSGCVNRSRTFRLAGSNKFVAVPLPCFLAVE